MRHTNVLDKYVRKTQNDAQERNTDKYVYAFDMALERDPTELDAGETGR